MEWIPTNRSDYMKYSREINLMKFYRKSISEQWGILLLFFDSVNIDLDDWYDQFRYDLAYITNPPSRPEAQAAAINKADELYNNAA